MTVQRSARPRPATAAPVDTKVVDERTVFVQDPKFFTTIGGEQHEIRPITWGVDERLLEKIGELIGMIGITDLVAAEAGEERVVAITNMLQAFFVQTPRMITQMLGIALGREDEAGLQWLRDNLDMDEVLNILVPLWTKRQTAITNKLFQSSFVETLVKKTQQAVAPKEQTTT